MFVCTVIEKYTRNTRFCLICNYVSKIIPALQSRCTKFRFAPLGAASVTERVTIVIDKEKCVRMCACCTFMLRRFLWMFNFELAQHSAYSDAVDSVSFWELL